MGTHAHYPNDTARVLMARALLRICARCVLKKKHVRYYFIVQPDSDRFFKYNSEIY